MPGWHDTLAATARRNRQEIVHAKLGRREMMRLGLLTGAGTLALKGGLSSRALAKDGSGSPASPAHTPWRLPLPTLSADDAWAPVDHHALRGGECTGKTPIDGAAKEVQHWFCSYDGNTGAWGAGLSGRAEAPVDFYDLVMNEGKQQFASNWPKATAVWGFGGWDTNRYPNKYPGLRVNARYGRPAMLRFHNELPYKTSTYKGFGIPEITTHLHNGHTPSESDGNPVNFIPSVQDVTSSHTSYRKDANGRVYSFKDQHYPNIYAGGDPREAMGSLWFHDHHLDFTAQNVVKGMVGCYTLFDDKDTGVEGTGLRLPAGRYDQAMFLGDFIFDQNYQVVFDLFNSDGILGDKQCVNGVVQPFFNVERRRYRFRLYNNGPSRFYEVALYDGSNFIPFWQLSNDGNLLPSALKVNSVRLFVAERADILIDFGKPDPRKTYYLVNRMEQTDGRKPSGKTLTPGTGLLQLNLTGGAVSDPSADPEKGELKAMRELPDDLNTLLAKINDPKVTKRTFRFERSNGSWVVNGKVFDENTVSANPAMGTEEIWTIQNPGGGWQHPVHIHFEEHRTLTRNGTPIPSTSSEYGRKDVIELGENQEVKVFMRFRDVKGRYVMHCHNVVHEDSGMMIRWDIV